jgi:hypothetical protein
MRAWQPSLRHVETSGNKYADTGWKDYGRVLEV